MNECNLTPVLFYNVTKLRKWSRNLRPRERRERDIKINMRFALKTNAEHEHKMELTSLKVSSISRCRINFIHYFNDLRFINLYSYFN